VRETSTLGRPAGHLVLGR